MKKVLWNALVDRKESNELVGRKESNALVGRKESNALVGRKESNALVGRKGWGRVRGEEERRGETSRSGGELVCARGSDDFWSTFSNI